MPTSTFRRPTRVTLLGANAATVSVDPPPPPPPPPSSWTAGVQRTGRQIFNPSCYLNLPVPNGVLVDAITPAVQQELLAEAALGSRPAMQSTKWSMPVYTVPASQPRVPVKFHTQPPQNFNKAQQQILLDPGMPIPPEHVNQGDSDDECLIYMPEQDLAWEFWRLRPLATPVVLAFQMPDGTTQSFTCSWECSNFWQITTVSTHLGRSRNHNAGTYPNAPTDPTQRAFSENTNMSVAATRVPFLGTLLTLEDVQRGLNPDGTLTAAVPSHMLNLSVVYPNTSHRFPATTDDGFKAGSPLEEGMRLFFDPAVYTVAAINALNVHPLCRLAIRFMATMGIVIVDKSGSLEIDAEPAVHDFYNGTAPSSILNGLPWGDLQTMAALNGDGTALTDASPFPH